MPTVKKTYVPPPVEHGLSQMITRAKRAGLFALYQLCIMIGIAAMPLALATHRVGLTLPIHRLLVRVGEAYEATLEERP